MDRDAFDWFIKDHIRKAWNTIAFSGTTDPKKDSEYFQRILKPFEREVSLIINSILIAYLINLEQYVLEAKDIKSEYKQAFLVILREFDREFRF